MENKNLLYTIPSWGHDKESLVRVLSEHPEVKFVSLVAVDIFGRDTDEKIPITELISDPEKFLAEGVQTDGSSVLLPLITDTADGSVTLIPDLDVNWYVDYNSFNYDEETMLPVGTLRIPAYLMHNGSKEVGSRAILRDTLESFKKEVKELILAHPYVCENLGFASPDEIEDITLTSATELEFYVKTPNEDADKELLHVSQEMKEQYWKRTIGIVRTALESTLIKLDKYGFGVEMGHKEVGGVKAEFLAGGDYDHIMEQLEIDWRYASPMQAADNDYQVRHIVKDTFREYNLDVSFMAKPVEGAAGSGKHTHIGVFANLKNGSCVNLFSPKDALKDYLSPIGYGAVMGLLKNYEVINPIANCNIDSLNRLKPGYEAPVCAVTSLGKDISVPTRNRTVLAGLIRDPRHPGATRFELRSPNPKSNTYLVVSACLLAMLDGISASLSAEKSSAELLSSISKGYGDEDFYLETNRAYRAECNIFEDYTEKERTTLFGSCPKTVYESFKNFDLYPGKAAVLLRGGFDKTDLESFRAAATDLWSSELHDRSIPEYRNRIKACAKKLHDADSLLDEERFAAILALARCLAKDTSKQSCLLTLLSRSIEEGRFEEAAELSVEVRDKVSALEAIYSEYKKNII